MPPPTPKTITSAQFSDVLARYPRLVNVISTSKALKPGHKSLEELDLFRYIEAPKNFGLGNATRSAMDREAIKLLVEWKLRHGKFRPTLMSLVSNNPADLVANTIRQAIDTYTESGAAPALEILKRLKGIGPATASLLLSVHDVDKVPFFSDEAYHWLCCNGRKESIQYKAQEYDELAQEAVALMQRLDVGALDIERVAYVLMKENAESSTTKALAKKTTALKNGRKAPSEKKNTPQSKEKDAPAGLMDSAGPEARMKATKRYAEPADETAATAQPLRRSKRNKP
ncbi:hypothetical protein BROUX41_002833 [Berkeleyomyces rouxiae]|uniref:uncharacterized protein n=1 Tax=Berkeleyomyces rouxiae TaxID=2035830 RepID=UPI003B81F014